MTGDERADLVERLVALGLDEREAKLYLHLLLGGPSRASDAASATRLKRTETYRALDVLMRRGFVTAHLAKPIVYEANAPDAVFGDILATHEQRRNDIERLREQVAHAVAEARRQGGHEAGKHGYKILQGRRAILHQVETMLRHAEVDVAVASTILAGPTFVSQNRAWSALVKRARGGLPIRLLVRETEALDAGLADMGEGRNAETRLFLPEKPIRFVIVDRSEVVILLVNDPAEGVEGRDDVAMWTNAQDFVHAQLLLYDALWREGRKLDPARAAPRNLTPR